MLNTPIAYIIFNRPRQTAQTFAAIRAQKPRHLLIIADGPRKNHPTDIERCQETRAIVKEIDWPCHVQLNYSDENLGCKRRVSSGLDWVFEQVESAIVLEDDCLPNNDFFVFCDKLLQRYATDERVWAITGNNFQGGRRRSDAAYYFSKYNHCWGWATWKDRWESIEWDANKLISDITQSELEHIFDLGGKFPYFRMLQEQAEGKIDSWAIRWHASMFLQSRLTIYPNRSLVGNTGFDNSGTHGKKSNSYETQICYEKIPIPNPIKIEESESFRNAIGNFYFSLTTEKEPFIYRLRKKTSSFIRGF